MVATLCPLRLLLPREADRKDEEDAEDKEEKVSTSTTGGCDNGGDGEQRRRWQEKRRRSTAASTVKSTAASTVKSTAAAVGREGGAIVPSSSSSSSEGGRSRGRGGCGGQGGEGIDEQDQRRRHHWSQPLQRSVLLSSTIDSTWTRKNKSVCPQFGEVILKQRDRERMAFELMLVMGRTIYYGRRGRMPICIIRRSFQTVYNLAQDGCCTVQQCYIQECSDQSRHIQLRRDLKEEEDPQYTALLEALQTVHINENITHCVVWGHQFDSFPSNRYIIHWKTAPAYDKFCEV